MTRLIERLDDIAGRYDAAFVDLWGCVHDGLRAYPAAVEALRLFRQGGRRVVLVTNAPRPADEVARQLARLNVPDDAWDAIASSGDSARLAMFRGTVGSRVHHIGTPGDEPFFTPPAMLDDPVAITRVPLAEAEGLVVTGPEDPHADPSVYRPQLLMAKTRGLKLLCANPDVVVDRGERREWCAGALAELYTEMGGESLYFGKPHPPIYDLARRRLGALGPMPEEAGILCIGDGPDTDIAGALGEGLDAVYVTGGLARAQTGTGPEPGGQPDPARLDALLAEQQTSVTFAMGYLR